MFQQLIMGVFGMTEAEKKKISDQHKKLEKEAREKKQKLKHLEHRQPPIGENTRNNQPKKGVNAEEENEEEI